MVNGGAAAAATVVTKEVIFDYTRHPSLPVNDMKVGTSINSINLNNHFTTGPDNA
jgi:hypothetical protein